MAACAAALVLAACAPLAPPPYATPSPVEATPSADGGDGFTALEQVALRVWTTTCDAFLNGTAWMLDESHAVTNRHVVDGATEIELTDYQGRSYHAVAAQIATTDDLALITIDGSFPRQAAVAAEPPAQGDTLTVSGFALGGPLGTVEGPLLATVGNDLDPDGASVYQIRVEVREGNSGSPVANADGEVTAVIFSSDGASIGGAVTLERLRAFLDGETPRVDAMTRCG